MAVPAVAWQIVFFYIPLLILGLSLIKMMFRFSDIMLRSSIIYCFSVRLFLWLLPARFYWRLLLR